MNANHTLVPSMTILYVEDPNASADFYERLFGIAPVDRAATFSLFALPSGLHLGLWAKAGAQPQSDITGGGCELVIRLGSHSAVDETYAAWRALGIEAIQPPVTLDFGHTFTVADPDGHRLRVFCPGE